MKKILIIVSIAILLWLYHFIPATAAGQKIRSWMISAGAPWYGVGFSIQSALSRQSNSEETIARLALENARLQTLAEENRQLRSLFQLKEKNQGNILVADVLAQTVLLGRNFIIINRGAADGVTANLPVVAYDGVMLGKTVEANEKNAQVLLVTDNASSLAASLSAASEVKAVARGKNGFGLTLDLIPPETPVAVGDIAVTSSLEENTPAGLPLGRVVSVSYKEGELFKQAELESLVAPPSVRAVGVILPPS